MQSVPPRKSRVTSQQQLYGGPAEPKVWGNCTGCPNSGFTAGKQTNDCASLHRAVLLFLWLARPLVSLCSLIGPPDSCRHETPVLVLNTHTYTLSSPVQQTLCVCVCVCVCVFTDCKQPSAAVRVWRWWRRLSLYWRWSSADCLPAAWMSTVNKHNKNKVSGCVYSSVAMVTTAQCQCAAGFNICDPSICLILSSCFFVV